MTTCMVSGLPLRRCFVSLSSQRLLVPRFSVGVSFSTERLVDAVQRTNLYGDKPQPSNFVAGVVPTSKLEKGYDIVVIGGGPSGVSAAFQSALLGHSVLIVDQPKSKPDYRGVDASFGAPTGLFSKALRDAAKRLDVTALRAQGLDDDVIWKQITNQCARVAMRNAESVIDTLQKYHVDYQKGSATLKKSSGDRVAVEVTIAGDDNNENERALTVPAGNVLLATGSKPFRLNGIPFDGVRVFDNDTINTLQFLPKSVAIAGGGIIAIEYARIFRKLGADVTLVIREESAAFALDRMGMDRDISRTLVNSMIQEGIKVYPNAVVGEFLSVPRHLEIPLQMTLVSGTRESTELTSQPVYGGMLEADLYIAAIGRKPTIDLSHNQTKTLGLQDVGIEWDDGKGIVVDRKTYQTTNPNVYASGDVIGRPALASTGAEQAKKAVVNMFDSEKAQERSNDTSTATDDIFPVGIWTTPEIGYYGYTKEKAVEEGYDVEVGEASYKNCLRGRVFAPEGMLKLVFEKQSGIILGVHIIGDDACELIHYGMGLVQKKVQIFALCNEVFTAVTYHELFKEAALDGDAKLDFGAAWQDIFDAVSEGIEANNIPTSDELRRIFDEIDTSHNGILTVDNVDRMFQKLGSNVSRSYIEKLIRSADLDGSGGIDFEEFEIIFNGLASHILSGNICSHRHRSNLAHHLKDRHH